MTFLAFVEAKVWSAPNNETTLQRGMKPVQIQKRPPYEKGLNIFTPNDKHRDGDYQHSTHVFKPSARPMPKIWDDPKYQDSFPNIGTDHDVVILIGSQILHRQSNFSIKGGRNAAPYLCSHSPTIYHPAYWAESAKCINAQIYFVVSQNCGFTHRQEALQTGTGGMKS